MTYEVKYAKVPKPRLPGMRGLKPKPEHWETDEARIKFDMKYAWMKHKAQAKYRKEEYTLTLEDWFELWTIETFLKRGRTADSYCLYMDDFTLGWHRDNVIVGERSDYLKKAKEYREYKRAQS
jgi:hypothetical protein